MELRDSGRGRLKDLADVAGHKVAETAKAATQRAVDMARDAEEAAREAAGSAAQFADAAGRMLLDRVGDLKSAAFDNVEKIGAHNLDPYEEAICEYNRAFTAMSDKGIAVLRQRERSTDLIELVERLVNSIANTPKAFEADFEEIEVHRAQFIEAQEFARNDLEAARKSAAGAGGGFAVGVAVASMAPTAAMWAATTFGVASTGTAISTLSGAAATNAALAWLGGGALAVGGGGTAAGTALLALAGPIGWTVAGATLLVSITLFAKKKFDNREAKQEALAAVKRNVALVEGMDAQLDDLLRRTARLRESLMASYGDALLLFGADFRLLAPGQRSQLAALVNNTKACAALLSTRIEQATDE